VLGNILRPSSLAGAKVMSKNDNPEDTRNWAFVVFSWLLVSLPLLWGIWQTVKKASALFQ